MIRYPKRIRLLAASLSALAGYVDAIGYLKLGGFFVSFMSGNSTRLGVGLATGRIDAAIAAGLVGCFVLGVVAGSLTGSAAGAQRRPMVLALVCVLLAAAATLGGLGVNRLALAAMAAAMGAENAVFAENGEVRIGLTYMTGTLVKLGQRLADLLLGRDRLGWASYLLLWLGLVLGAVCGAAAFRQFDLAALWGGAAGAAALGALALKIGSGAEETRPAAARG